MCGAPAALGRESEINDRRLLAWVQWRVAWDRPTDVCRKDSFAPSTTHDDNAKDILARCNEARVLGPNSVHCPTPDPNDNNLPFVFTNSDNKTARPAPNQQQQPMKNNSNNNSQ